MFFGLVCSASAYPDAHALFQHKLHTKRSFSVIPTNGVDDAPGSAGLSSVGHYFGEGASTMDGTSQLLEAAGTDDSGVAFQKAQNAATAVWDVADQLYAAASRENERDANRRMERAIGGARQKWAKLPGHEFAPKLTLGSEAALLSEKARLKSSSATCSGNGEWNAATRQCACSGSWVGALCDVQRCPGDCTGRGMCLSGKCICNPQHFGDSCQHARCPEDCSGHGYCFSGKCQCSGNFGGDNCLLQVHSANVVRFKLARKTPLTKGPPVELSSLRATAATSKSQNSLISWQTQQQCPGDCSQQGACIKGKCLCHLGYQGGDCSIVGACRAHGMPKVVSMLSVKGKKTKHTTCVCDQGWSGADCDVELVCPDQSCSGHGICSYGRCMCGAGYSGHACHVSLQQVSYSATGDNHTKKYATLLGVQRSHAGLQSNAFAQTGFQAKMAGEASSDEMGSPMTAAWLRPAALLPPAPKKTLKLDARPGSVSNEALWHPAITPPAAAPDSILAMLSVKAEETSLLHSKGGAAWTERASQQGHSSHRAPSTLPKKLVSMLDLSPKLNIQSVLSSSMEEPASDIDTLLADI